MGTLQKPSPEQVWTMTAMNSSTQSETHSRVQFFAMPWAAAQQAPVSMEPSRQNYWGGLPFPSPRDCPDSGIEPRSPVLQADFSLPSEAPGKPKVPLGRPVTRKPAARSPAG